MSKKVSLYPGPTSPEYDTFEAFPCQFLDPFVNIIGYNQFLEHVPTEADTLTEEIYNSLLEHVYFYTQSTRITISLSVWETAFPENCRVSSATELLTRGFTLDDLSQVSDKGIVEFLKTDLSTR
jgi:hypothetical protein